MPMARKVADSRVRSITDRLSVFATPTKAMSTATAIKPTNNAIMPLIMVSHCVRSATGPVTVTPGTGGEHILHVGEYVVQRNTRAFGVNAHKHDMPVGLDSTVGEVAGVHEGDRGVVGGDAAIVHLPRFERQRLCAAGLSIAVFGAAVRIIAGRTIGGIGLCFGRSSRERDALVQRNILAW